MTNQFSLRKITSKYVFERACGWTVQDQSYHYVCKQTSHDIPSIFMMTSPNRNILRVTGPVWGESIGHLVDSPHKGQWRGALMLSLICAIRSGWGNNRDAGDLRRHHPHYDITALSIRTARWHLKPVIVSCAWYREGPMHPALSTIPPKWLRDIFRHQLRYFYGYVAHTVDWDHGLMKIGHLKNWKWRSSYQTKPSGTLCLNNLGHKQHTS